MTQVLWLTSSPPKRAAMMRSPMAKPTAVAMPWPKGPVVVSTPSVWPYSGWPGVLLPHCAEIFQILQGKVIAVQVEEGVEKHGTMARGKDEPVPVDPLGVGRGMFQVAAPKHVGGGSHAHGHARVARVGLSGGVDRQHADGVDGGLMSAWSKGLDMGTPLKS